MLVIPAIDLKDGRCVRLVRGDMTQATVYADDPVAVARGFEAGGAEWIHVVDLDGAIRGAPVNADAIGAVCRAVDARVEVGGGVRDLDTLERVFAAGAGRVVLGTAALEDPDLFGEACRRHPGAILAGIDARAGKVAVAGWVRDSATEATALAARVADAGAAGIVFTDIARDGTGSGVNAAAVDALDDVRALRALGRPNLTAVIVGRALYTGAVDLAAALRVGRGEDASDNRRGDG